MPNFRSATRFKTRSTAPPALEGRVFGALDAAQPNTASWGKGVAAVALLGMLALGWSLSGTEESSPEPAIQAPVDAVLPVEVESPRIEEVSIEAATPVDVAPIQSEIVPSRSKKRFAPMRTSWRRFRNCQQGTLTRHEPTLN